jgi:plasmid stabilization system protein ParE
VRPVLVQPAAAADIEEAFLWYEGQRVGLGLEFRSELEATIDRVAANPQLYQVVHRNTRRALLRRFPYGVLYRAYPEAIIVVAVMHGRRAPKRWQSRS